MHIICCDLRHATCPVLAHRLAKQANSTSDMLVISTISFLTSLYTFNGSICKRRREGKSESRRRRGIALATSYRFVAFPYSIVEDLCRIERIFIHLNAEYVAIQFSWFSMLPVTVIVMLLKSNVYEQKRRREKPAWDTSLKTG